MAKRFAGPILGLILSLALAGTALAEGTFTSYMYQVGIGFNSRTWVDHNNDNVGTVIKLWNCRDGLANGSGDWAKLKLLKHNFIFPSTNMGTKTFYCYDFDSRSWGDVAGADYNFEVYEYGPNPVGDSGGCICEDRFELDVDPLRVNY